ncbi:sigma 54-interacting transcriptional regulator [Sorangium sp. So ce341]|uniref:sigma 54-interacting transcriptional regulator n=1 Tax=Sorangium sp. So ce341 TaxID=3133302 RepID=UPI003F5E087C
MGGDDSKICTLTDGEESSVVLPSAQVVATLPHNVTREARLTMDLMVVGTGPECDLIVPDARVSRRHCELKLTRRGVVLRDLGSKNGTFIGEIPVMEAILPAGAVATIGSTRLSIALEGAPSLVRLSASERFGEAIGRSVVMRALFAQLERAAATAETILLLGESGTGKEVLARAIHAASPRRDGPLVIVDCGAVAPSLVEAELFGHTRGAFTGAVAPHAGLLEQADGGTLFIDELGELPLDLQPKLLRALEARQIRRVGSSEWRPFDARVIAATHRDLRARVAEGTFRQDLYYRLAVVEVRVPALRERKDDIPALVERFLAAQSPPRALSNLPPNVMDVLLSHDWPGNVRELRNMVSRLVIFPDLAREALGVALAPSRAEAAPPARRAAAPSPASAAERAEAPAAGTAEDGLSALLQMQLHEARDAVVEHFERRYVAAKLREHGGNVSRTADAIGVSRQLVYRLIERYGLRGAERA